MRVMLSGVWAPLCNDSHSRRYDSSEQQVQGIEFALGPGQARPRTTRRRYPYQPIRLNTQ